MVADYIGTLTAMLGIPAWLLWIVFIWSLAWKGIALWISARKTHTIWFVIILIMNTMGILEILYIFLFSKINLNKAGKSVKETPRAKRRRR